MAELREQFDEVRKQTSLGRAHLQLWEDLGKRLNTEPTRTLVTAISPTFFGLTLEAHLNAAILYAAKIFDSHDDTLNIKRLLERASNEKRKIPPARLKILEDNLRTARAKLPGIESVLEAIKTRRDKTLAHIDKKVVSKPDEVVRKGRLTVAELGKAFSLAETILNGVSDPYWKFTVVFEILGIDDYTRALGYIESGRQRDLDNYQAEFGHPAEP